MPGDVGEADVGDGDDGSAGEGAEDDGGAATGSWEEKVAPVEQPASRPTATSSTAPRMAPRLEANQRDHIWSHDAPGAPTLEG